MGHNIRQEGHGIPSSQEAVDTMCVLAEWAQVVLRKGVGRCLPVRPDGLPAVDDDVAITSEVLKYIDVHWPDVGVLGECRLGEDLRWEQVPTGDSPTFVIDAIDGPAMYAAGLGLAVFAMAYTNGRRTRAAVIDDPYTRTRYVAVRKGGLTVNGAPTSISARPRTDIVAFEAGIYCDRGFRRSWRRKLRGFTLCISGRFRGLLRGLLSGLLQGLCMVRVQPVSRRLRL